MIEQVQIKSQHAWLITLLKQYSSNIEFTDTADIVISDAEHNVIISLKNSQQQWIIPKPISVLEIINKLEQIKNSMYEHINIGELSFYPNQRFCIFNNETIHLTQKETEILLYLSNNRHSIDKATLLVAIWGYSRNISTHTLETHIYKLRNKFAGKYDIITSSEEGYALNL